MKWIEYWVVSEPSPSHPDRNEDNFWIAASSRAVAVIDGMGGYRRRTRDGEIGGEHAAALTAQVLQARLDGWEGTLSLEESKQALRSVIEEINGEIWEKLNYRGEVPAIENLEGKEVDELSVGVAMTLVALTDDGRRAVAAQHGDTHGYIFKQEMGLIQITEDQDLLLWDRLNGRLSPAEAARIAEDMDHFDGIHLTEAVDEKVLRYLFDKNIFGALGVNAQCPGTGWSAIRLAAGDRLALLSDGAYSNMSIDEIGGLIGDDEPAVRIVELARQRGALPRFPDPNDPGAPYNMRATRDDMTALILTLGSADAGPAPGAAGWEADARTGRLDVAVVRNARTAPLNDPSHAPRAKTGPLQDERPPARTAPLDEPSAPSRTAPLGDDPQVETGS